MPVKENSPVYANVIELERICAIVVGGRVVAESSKKPSLRVEIPSINPRYVQVTA